MPNTITGTRNDELLAGSADADLINAGAGNDMLGSASGDTLIGADGNDTLSGAGGHDEFNGGAGNDSINGGAGDDGIFQDFFSGSDSIDGGDGSDALYYGYAGEIPEGASILVDFVAGTVSKYVAGELIGVDTIANIDSVVATGSIHMDSILPPPDIPDPTEGLQFIVVTGAPQPIPDYSIG